MRLHRTLWMALAAIIALARCAGGEAAQPDFPLAVSSWQTGPQLTAPQLAWPTPPPTPVAPGESVVAVPRTVIPRIDSGVTASGQGSEYVIDDLLPLMHAAEDRYGLPRGVLASMATWESSGGLHRCGFNLTGYASCRVTFSSFEEGIEVTARTLASYGPADIRGKLCIWVGGTVCTTAHEQAYAERVIGTMASFQ